MTHVLIRAPERGSGSMDLAVSGSRSLPHGWFAIRQPPELPPSTSAVVDQPYKGAAGLRKKPPAVLPLGDFLAQLVVTKDVAKKLGLSTRTIAFEDAKGTIAKDYELVEIDEQLPLDRKASKATFENGWLATIEHATWGERCGALPKIFRLLDRPAFIFIERSLAEILKKADKKIFLDDYAFDPPDRFPPAWSRNEIPPIAKSASSEDAFWSLRSAKRADAKTRKAALTDPWWAYATAVAIDRKSAADTRAAAAKSPIVAALYATEVDRKADPITRRAACASGLGALRYATHIDLAIDPKLKKAILRDAGHDEETFAKEAEHIAEVALWLKGDAPPPAKLPTFPKPKVDRYAAKTKKKKLPRHEPVESALRSDIDAFVGRGYARLGLGEDPNPQAVVDALASYIGNVQSGKIVISKKQLTNAQMELGCAWGEQLHRALSWQWANVLFDGGAALALVSGDRALAHYPFVSAGGALKKGSKRNTLPLLFAMLVAGNVPPSSADGYTTVA